MIRINVLKNTGGSSKMNTSMSNMTDVTLMGSGEDSSSPDAKKVWAKLAVALVIPLALVAYDFYASHLKEQELQQLKAQVSQVQAKIASYGDKAKSVRRFQKEKKSLERRIEIIKQLSSERLQVLKTLDALHQIIPKKAWLINYTAKNGNVKIVGKAVDDSIVSATIQNLDESIYFDQVRLESSKEIKEEAGNIREFIINARLGG